MLNKEAVHTSFSYIIVLIVPEKCLVIYFEEFGTCVLLFPPIFPFSPEIREGEHLPMNTAVIIIGMTTDLQK